MLGSFLSYKGKLKGGVGQFQLWWGASSHYLQSYSPGGDLVWTLPWYASIIILLFGQLVDNTAEGWEGKIDLHYLLKQVSKGASMLDDLGPSQVKDVELGNLEARVTNELWTIILQEEN